MEIFDIIGRILDKPEAPKFYRELREHYLKVGMLHEAESIGHLIEKKFEKNGRSLELTEELRKC